MKTAALLAETIRLRFLKALEERLASCGYAAVAGVDEAGRGCLAGPVVAAAYIPHPGRTVPGVDDSKRLGAAERERLAEALRRSAIAYSVAAVDSAVIDEINILAATKQAMRQAVDQLDETPDCVLVDAVHLPDLSMPCIPLIKGDVISYAIASASILAKVERDRLMTDLDRAYPHYGFAAHKGYGASVHREALARYGPCPLHRLTFRSVIPRTPARRTG